jgi:hypothetical protein
VEPFGEYRPVQFHHAQENPQQIFHFHLLRRSGVNGMARPIDFRQAMLRI